MSNIIISMVQKYFSWLVRLMTTVSIEYDYDQFLKKNDLIFLKIDIDSQGINLSMTVIWLQV